MDKSGQSIVFYFRSQQASTDGRLMRYLSFMHSHHIPYRALCWNRSGKAASGTAEHFHLEHYVMPARTGSRYFNAFKLIRWNFAIFAYCVKNRSQIKKIHCADFDSVLPCYLFSRLYSRPLIFDSYDRYSDSRRMGNPLKFFVDKIESYILQKADVAILPSRARIEQYQLKHTDNLVIIENVPLFGEAKPQSQVQDHVELRNALQQIRLKRSEFRAVLSYVGVLENDSRGLENLLTCVATMPDLALIVAGSGPLQNRMSEAAAQYPNIYFIGALDYSLAEQVMAFSDLHIGLYYLMNPNHKYAAPNKYFEHLYFGKALLTSGGTPPGEQVKRWSTGFTVADSKEALHQFLTEMTPDMLASAGEKAALRWQQQYANYYTEVFSCAYGQAVK